MRQYESTFSPWKRINDRINAINTSNHKLQRAKDHLDKDFRRVAPCDTAEELRTLRESAEVMRSDIDDLIVALDIQMSKEGGASA